MKEELRITSPAFSHNGQIPAKYTADGADINPPLVFAGVSSQAKSLVLIVDDPDAPVGVYDHWVVFNIPPSVREVAEGAVPAGAVQGKNSSGGNRYIGPAPPSGMHRYFFKLYELSSELDLDESATKQVVLDALQPVLLGQAELIGTYSRG